MAGMEDSEARARVGRARVGRLATIGSRAPHVVPICFVLDGDLVYSVVDRKPKRTLELQRLRNLTRDARATLLVDHYEEDWSRLWWVRLEGEASTLPPGAEEMHARRLLTEKYAQYRSAEPPGPVLRLVIRRWAGWAAS
jgi:PPOX class probable F420-dependent enzyme